jgi:transporter family protein
LVAIFATPTAILAKLGVSQVGSDFATLLRTCVVVVGLAALLTATGQWKNPISLTPKKLILPGPSGLAAGASWLCYFWALKLGDAARVAPLDKLSVEFVALLAALFLGERLSWVNWADVTMIAAGAVPVAVMIMNGPALGGAVHFAPETKMSRVQGYPQTDAMAAASTGTVCAFSPAMLIRLSPTI